MSSALIDRLKRTARLPSPPGTAVQILQICQQPDVDIAELANAIAPDPALSVRLLKYANSALLGATREVTSVREAVLRMGLRSVRLMALSFSLVSDDDPKACKGFEYRTFWAYSVACAVSSRFVARMSKKVSSEEAFAGGLLSHIGKLVFAVGMPEQYPKVLAATGGTLGHSEDAEEKYLSISHHKLGADLLTEWGIPATLCSAIRHQGKPDDLPEEEAHLKSFTEIISVGTRLADLVLGSVTDKQFDDYWKELTDSPFFESEEQAMRAATDISEEYYELAKILDLKDPSGRTVQEIQAEADSVLEELSLAAQIQSEAVEEENKVLEKQAWTDGLTQISNRAAFDNRLTELWAEAQQRQKPIALLILDIDHFKKFNDTYGHQTGDAVLRGVASCLPVSVRKVDFVARYGGEEFVAILPNADRLIAAQTAVKIRKAIESKQVEFEGNTHQVTASIGAVILDRVAPPMTADKLVEAADQQLYTSKEKGRNCCSLKHFVDRTPVAVGA